MLSSTVEQGVPWDLPSGEFVGDSPGDDSTTLVHLAPLGWFDTRP